MAFRFFSSHLISTRRAYLSRIALRSLNSNNINNIPMAALSLYANPASVSADISENIHFKIWKRGHLGHSHHHDHHDRSASNEGERIFRLGLAADISLAAGKAITGYLSGSTAIIADAAHSLSDVVLSGVALFSFKAAMAPKDKEHPYGHGKFETLGALGISGVLLATAGGIGWHAMDVLVGVWSAAPEMANLSMAHEHMHGAGSHVHGIDMNHPILALNMTIVSIAVKEGLYWVTKRAGERVGSGLMKANAWHHRADAISSIVALIGVGGSILGVRFLDPLAGLVVSGMIFKAGIQSGYQSVLELVDAAIPAQQLEPYRQTILQVDGVKGCNHFRGRRAGSFLYLDVNVEVDPFLSVSAAHGIAETVRHEIQLSHPEISEVFIHIEPSTSDIPAMGGQTKEDGNAEMKSYENADVDLQSTDIEDFVSNVLSARFAEKMHVERITRHVLQGQILLEIEVSMPTNMLIRDAVIVAKEAEKEIQGTVGKIQGVSIQLRLTGALTDLSS